MIEEYIKVKEAFDRIVSEELKNELWYLVCDYMDWDRDMEVELIVDLYLHVYVPKERARYMFNFEQKNDQIKVTLAIRERI